MRSVRIVVLAVCACLTALSSQGGEPVPVVQFVVLEELGRRCAITARVFACTVMETNFACRCASSTSGWGLKVTTDLIPHVFISHNRYLAHELGHIQDISSMLSEDASTLQSTNFSSLEDCQRASREAKRTFRERVRTFQAISAQRRDGMAAGVSY